MGHLKPDMSRANRAVDRSPAADTVKPSLKGLGDLLVCCGIRMSTRQLALLWRYHRFLRARNTELNLTRIHNFTSMVHKHYVDSILPALLMDLPSPLMDLGSGAGFPGIPLKIYRPDLELVLAESRGKRVDFLASAVAELGLSGVEVAGGKINDRFIRPVAGVISRAVLSIPRTLEAVRGCVDGGGLVILMKGPRCDDEIREAVEEFSSHFRLSMDEHYGIPGTGHRRRLVVFRRTGTSRAAVRGGPSPSLRVRDVESGENPVFKSLKKLRDSRGVRKAGKTLVSGEKLVLELVRRKPGLCEAWVSPFGDAPPPEGLPPGAEWIRLSPALFRVLDFFGTGHPILLAGIPPAPAWIPAEGFPEGCSLLVPFQDPENVGAVIRSAVAFDATQVIMMAGSAHPFHPKAVRASGGAVFSIPVRQGVSLDELPDDLPLLALSSQGRDITGMDFPGAFGLLAGVEGPGLPDRLERGAVGVPMSADMDSLNAAVAVSVTLYEWYAGRKRRR